MTTHAGATGPNPAEVYERFMVPLLFLPWAEELLGRLAPVAGERVLDVACGTGIVARRLAPIVGREGRVVGLDPSPAMLGVARSLPAPEGAAIEWVEAGAGEMPLPDGALDLVTCQQGLQFVPDGGEALREMRRVVAPAGRVGIAVWEGIERQPFQLALDAAVARRTGVRIFATGFSLGDAGALRAMLEEAGWRDVATESVERVAHAASAATLLRLHILGAAAALPELRRMSAGEIGALVEEIQADSAEILAGLVVGDGVSFPMRATIATARA